MLRYVTIESTLSDESDKTNNPSKTLQEKEKQLLDKMKVHWMCAELHFCFHLEANVVQIP